MQLHRCSRTWISAVTLSCVIAASHAMADDHSRLLRLDHYVGVRSTAPAIAGQNTPIYVREVVEAGAALRPSGSGNGVVLFIHGAGTPAEVAFDLDYEDYSWMAYLARAGFDVFAMDMTGYGRSTRPVAMNDPCNLSSAQQLALAPAGPICPPTLGAAMTTLASDWNDIGAVVGYVRALRGVAQVSLVGWSLGGPRAGGYAAQHPDQVERLVLLAPAYSRAAPTTPTAAPAAFNTQTHAELDTLWDSQVGCTDQYDYRTNQALWQAMLDSDPVGASWGAGVRRAPNVLNGGWTSAMVATMQVPTLMVTGAYDKQVPPARVHELYADLGAKSKVLVDLACSSHNAIWERNHLLLFRASLEWLTSGTVNGMAQGTLRLGF